MLGMGLFSFSAPIYSMNDDLYLKEASNTRHWLKLNAGIGFPISPYGIAGFSAGVLPFENCEIFYGAGQTDTAFLCSLQDLIAKILFLGFADFHCNSSTLSYKSYGIKVFIDNNSHGLGRYLSLYHMGIIYDTSESTSFLGIKNNYSYKNDNAYLAIAFGSQELITGENLYVDWSFSYALLLSHQYTSSDGQEHVSSNENNTFAASIGMGIFL